MERWNELAAGYVLGNLTEEEQAELSAVLREHPQLKVEIARLRKTATMSWPSVSDNVVEPLSIEHLSAGAQGWSDTVTHFPESSPSARGENDVTSGMTTSEMTSGVTRDATSPDEVMLHASATSDARSVSIWSWISHLGSSFIRLFGRRTNPWSWLMAFILVGVSFDNWRMRRLLEIAQERIFQLELSSEYEPSNAE